MTFKKLCGSGLRLVFMAAFFGGMAMAAPAQTAFLDSALFFSDGSAGYMQPQEPSADQSVAVKFRTGKDNADQVMLVYGDRDFTAVPMVKLLPPKKDAFGAFDYWIGEIPPAKVTTNYYFQVYKGKDIAFYSRQGVEKNAPRNSYQFKIIPGFTVPAWMRGAVLYQIYTDRFYNGDPGNDVVDNEYLYDNWPSVRVKDWNQIPDPTAYSTGGNRTREFFGGDIEGVIQKLPYLKSLGIDGIYFNPMFVSPSNHKYDAQDYENIDPHFGVIVKDTPPGIGLIEAAKDPIYKSPAFDKGSAVNKGALKYITRTTSQENLDASNAKMKELIDKAHSIGIKVIMDGVFNHVGSFSKWLDRENIYPASQGPGAYESKDSPFASYFKFGDQKAWPNNESYDAWYGFKTLPKLYFENSAELTKKIMDIGAMWVGKYKVDGWRLDVAADLGYSPKFNHQFWEQFRTSVKSANPDAVILAEVYGDASSWLNGREWDTVMNYDAFFEPIGWFLTGLEKHSDYARADLLNESGKFDASLREKMAKLPYNSLEVAMNQLDNHDHSRFLTRTSGFIDKERGAAGVSDPSNATLSTNKGILKEATVFQMTMPGAPTLYYGDEVGLAGLTDPDSRRAFPWDPALQDTELLAFFKQIIAIHKQFPALKTGSFSVLNNFRFGHYAYARWDAKDRIIVAMNNRATDSDVTIPLKAIDSKPGETFTVIFRTDVESHSVPDAKDKTRFVTANELGVLTVEVAAHGTVMLRAPGAREPGPVISARPMVSAVLPGAGAKNVDPASPILVQFTMSMDPRSVLGKLTIQPEIKGKFSWNGNLLTFKPDRALAPATAYTVSVQPGLRSQAGNISSTESRSWSFTTK